LYHPAHPDFGVNIPAPYPEVFQKMEEAKTGSGLDTGGGLHGDSDYWLGRNH